MTALASVAGRGPAFICPPRKRELRRLTLAEPWALVAWPGRRPGGAARVEPAMLFEEIAGWPRVFRGRLLCHVTPALIPAACVLRRWHHRPHDWGRVIRAEQLLAERSLPAGRDPRGNPCAAGRGDNLSAQMEATHG